MNRALRRHQKKVARLRRVRILRDAHGAWKPRSFMSPYSAETAWGWEPKVWRYMCRLAMREPGWWTHERMIQPARIESHRMERHLERGLEPDLFIWPDYRKPKHYYW
jgi:hypothetical protein